jgi:hypothetical protein
MDAGENCLNHIHLTNDSLLGNHKWKGRTDLLNIFLIGLSGKLPEAGNDKYKLHRFLGTVFSDSMTTNEKINLLENEYKIPMEQQLKEGKSITTKIAMDWIICAILVRALWKEQQRE